MPTFSLLHYAITFHRIQHMESRPQGAGNYWVSARAELVGLTSRATTVAVGTTSCSNASCFGPNSTPNVVIR
jgi:hypothetical protein